MSLQTEHVDIRSDHILPGRSAAWYLEVDEEAVELPLAGAAVEVLAAGVEQRADHAQAEQVLGGVQGARAAVLVHAEGDEGEEGAEDDGRLHHAVVVELAQELGAADAALVELGLVDLATEREK